MLSSSSTALATLEGMLQPVHSAAQLRETHLLPVPEDTLPREGRLTTILQLLHLQQSLGPVCSHLLVIPLQAQLRHQGQLVAGRHRLLGWGSGSFLLASSKGTQSPTGSCSALSQNWGLVLRGRSNFT